MIEDSRYKIFRNFMANELKITKEDIVVWTEAAIEAIVERMIATGKLNVQAALDRAVDRAVRSALQLNQDLYRHQLEQKILDHAAKKIKVTVE